MNVGCGAVDQLHATIVFLGATPVDMISLGNEALESVVVP